MKLLYIIIFICSLTAQDVAAAKKATKDNARELFLKVYDLAFGKQGSSLSYSVNIIGLYKTQGNVIFKEKKMQYEEKRYCAWEDGKVAYMVDKNEKKVDIHDFNDEKKAKYFSMFKYDLNNYSYSYKVKGDYYELTAKVKESKFLGIRSVTALVHKSNLYPVSLSIKLAFISTTVKISNFRSGGIDDSVFTFPEQRFRDYKHIDHRYE